MVHIWEYLYLMPPGKHSQTINFSWLNVRTFKWFQKVLGFFYQWSRQFIYKLKKRFISSVRHVCSYTWASLRVFLDTVLFVLLLFFFLFFLTCWLHFYLITFGCYSPILYFTVACYSSCQQPTLIHFKLAIFIRSKYLYRFIYIYFTSIYLCHSLELLLSPQYICFGTHLQRQLW